MAFQQAGAARFAARLADDVAELVSEQRLPVHGDQVELAGGKGNMAALRQRVRAGICHSLAFIQLDAGKICAERIFHFGLNGRRQVHLMTRAFDGRQVVYRAQGVGLRRFGSSRAAVRYGARGGPGFF